MKTWKLMPVTVFTACVLLSGCADAFYTDPAPATTHVQVQAAFSSALNGEVFDKANRVMAGVWLDKTVADSTEIEEGNADVLIDQSFKPAPEVRLQLAVDVPSGTHTAIVAASIMQGDLELFIGYQQITLTNGQQPPAVTLTLRPEIDVHYGPPPRTLTFIGDTMTVVAIPRFATGDIVAGVTCTYTSLNTAIVQVNATTGRIVATGPGQAPIVADCNDSSNFINVVVNPVGAATLAGVVASATTGNPIAGATVTVTSGTQPTRTATTGATGGYSINNLATGLYNVSVAAAGFNTLNTSVQINPGTNQRQFALSPPAAAGTFRIILTWGSAPQDLDSHLFINSANGGAHIFFGNEGTTSAFPFAQLDTDDQSGFGPETITISSVQTGAQYRYQVDNFSGESALSASGARVEVYNGNTLVNTFTVPNQPGTLWNVFNMQNGVITQVNTMSNSDPAVRLPGARK